LATKLYKPLKNLDLLMIQNQGISTVYNITVSEKLLKNLQNPPCNPLKNKRKKEGVVGRKLDLI